MFLLPTDVGQGTPARRKFVHLLRTCTSSARTLLKPCESAGPGGGKGCQSQNSIISYLWRPHRDDKGHKGHGHSYGHSAGKLLATYLSDVAFTLCCARPASWQGPESSTSCAELGFSDQRGCGSVRSAPGTVFRCFAARRRQAEGHRHPRLQHLHPHHHLLRKAGPHTAAWC